MIEESAMLRQSLLGAAMVMLLLAGCDQGQTRKHLIPLRYKLVATVDTPEGVRKGSSVIEIKSHIGGTVGILGSMAGSGYSVSGEAVTVDLPRRQVLFILMRSKSNLDWDAWAVRNISEATNPPVAEDPPPSERTAFVAWYDKRWNAMLRDRATHIVWGGDVPKGQAQYLPYMVMFDDIADPKSVKQVDPTDLKQAFGPGFALRSLTIQVTDEPITSTIQQRLRWLKPFPEPRLVPIPSGGTVNPTFGQKIAHGDFRKGGS